MSGSFPPALLPLMGKNRWLQWGWRWNARRGTWDKPPCDRWGNVASFKSVQRSFDEVWRDFSGTPGGLGAPEQPLHGVGFGPRAEDGWLFIDIDDCRDARTGEVSAAAMGIVEACGSYVEVTPSGTGLRVIGLAGTWKGPDKVSYAWPDSGDGKPLKGEVYCGTGYVTISFACIGYGDRLADVSGIVEAILGESIGGGAVRVHDDGDVIANPSREAPVEVVRETLAAIDNAGVPDWSWWKEKIGMAVWGASGGSEEGLEAWIEWSRRNPGYQDGDCEAAWDEMGRSPPEFSGYAGLWWQASVSRGAVGEAWNGGPEWRSWKARSGAGGLGVLPRVPGLDSSVERPGGRDGHEASGGVRDGSGLPVPGGLGGSDDGDGIGTDDDGLPAWTAHFQRAPGPKGKPGEARPTLLNGQTALRMAPEWAGVLTYDEFSDRVILTAAPPWEREAGIVGGTGDAGSGAEWRPREMKETDATNAAVWMQRHQCQVSDSIMHRAMMAEAERRRCHVVRDYLGGLIWDGQARIDRLLIDHLGAEDTELTRVFTGKTLIAAVARVMDPGCQVKTVLMLEGDQDIGKSKFCAALVPVRSWYTDQCPPVDDKDALQQLRGIWIQEHAELATMRRTEANRAKAFISSNVDRYRPSHGRLAQDFPRQCIFIATVNPDGVGHLTDATGGARFWPVACGVGWAKGRTMDDTVMVRERDQIWAEAVARYSAGEAWWLDNMDIKAQQREAVDERFEEDVWIEHIGRFLAEPSEDRRAVSIAMVLQAALGKGKDSHTKADQARVATCLKRLGRVKRRLTIGGKRDRYWVDETDQTNVVQLDMEKGKKIDTLNSPGIVVPLTGPELKR